MARAAVHFELKAKSIVKQKATRSKCANDAGMDTKRITSVVTLAVDASKLIIFFTLNRDQLINITIINYTWLGCMN
jgi:hypothetical protein